MQMQVHYNLANNQFFVSSPKNCYFEDYSFAQLWIQYGKEPQGFKRINFSSLWILFLNKIPFWK